MGSLQVEKRNAKKICSTEFSEQRHFEKDTNDWKKVSVGRLLEILDFNTKATRTHILEK